MDITLQPELEQFVREKITSGQYQSVNEAVNAGLKILMERELIYQGRFDRERGFWSRSISNRGVDQLRQEIMVGIEASERGEVVDSETVFDSIRQKLEQKVINYE